MSPDEAYRIAKEILLPGGKPLGRPARGKDVREVSGGLLAAQEMFDKFSKLGRLIDDPRHPGKEVIIPTIGRIGLRVDSRSGEPTIDVNVIIDGVKISKIKFTE